MLSFNILSAIIILIVTLLSGLYPFAKRITSKQSFAFPVGEALASGVFLGAGLMHMLGDACHDFYHAGINYPIGFFLASVTFLLLLFLEHVGREIYSHNGAGSKSFAILACFMLSIHSFLSGAALGLSSSLAMSMIILFAILAHKWAASFSLATQITKSTLKVKNGIILFILFSLMAPLGVIFGHTVTVSLGQFPLLQPIFMSLAAGTFLYLGSLHGLERGVLVKQCCNLNLFYFVIAGFMLMAVVAIWT